MNEKMKKSVEEGVVGRKKREMEKEMIYEYKK